MSLDPRDPRFYRDPYGAYARILAECPVVFWEEIGCWCFFGDRDVNAILRDRRFGREVLHVASREELGWLEPPAHTRDFDAVDANSMLEREAPFHTRMRRLVSKAFVPRRVEALKPAIAALANELVDAFPSGPFDLIEAFAAPIPARMIARIMGVPESAVPQLVAWSHRMITMYGVARTHDTEVDANAAAADFAAFMRDTIAARRDTPADDMLTILIEAEALELMSEPEIVSTAILLLNAGHEASVHALGNAIRLLLERTTDPAQYLADDWSAGQLVEEALRYAPPLHLFKRYVLEDLEMGGVSFTKGDQVALIYGATGRDPKANANPDQFDPVRMRATHTSFGAGVHFCVGAPLARLELATALRVLFARCPQLRLVEPPVVKDSWHFHGLDQLIVEHTPSS
ncbi:MAG: cytochrome P450 [Gemmatimonadaceae bacterium]|nr:cytochrome P450 [Gemmatimonadaceae bacterium]